MPTIIFIDHEDNKINVTANIGDTLMEAALNNDINGIIGECGGNCVCATCHCFVAEEWVDKLPAMEEEENEMLDAAADPRDESSRLSCQIEITDALDGLTVYIPENQV